MQFKVYHDKNPHFGLEAYPPFNDQNYGHVATVECLSLEDAFRLTNHIDQYWTTNPEVIWKPHNRLRSTSVGDVIEDSVGN